MLSYDISSFNPASCLNLFGVLLKAGVNLTLDRRSTKRKASLIVHVRLKITTHDITDDLPEKLAQCDDEGKDQ